MTDSDAPRLPDGREGYGGPPPTERTTPQPYPAQPYPQPYGNPYGSPYPQPYGQPYGQQPPGYPVHPGYVGYPGYPTMGPAAGGPQRPGLVIASAVMAYVNAGLLLVSGAVVVFGASLVRSIQHDLGDGDTDGATWVILLGAADLVVGGLLIAGAIMFSGGRSAGRVMLSIANALVLVLFVVWIVSFADGDGGDGWIGWGVVFSILAVLSLAFSFTGAINRWLSSEAAR